MAAIALDSPAWIATRLDFEIAATVRKLRINRRLINLLRELDKPSSTRTINNLIRETMKFKFTEPMFFQGKLRQEGEVMDAPIGPYRVDIHGGVVKQYETIEEPVAMTDAPDVNPTAGTFAQATAAVLNPNPAPVPPTQTKSTASLISGLAARRNKLVDRVRSDAQAYAQRITVMETQAPAVFVKANATLDDETASFKELEDSLSELAGANGSPLSS